jgi:hypothetical protein
MDVPAEECIRRFFCTPGRRGFNAFALWVFVECIARLRSMFAVDCWRRRFNPRREWRDLYLALTEAPCRPLPPCGAGVLMVIEVLRPQPYLRPALQEST